MAYLEISSQTFRERTQITALPSSCRRDNKEKSCWKWRIKCFYSSFVPVFTVSSEELINLSRRTSPSVNTECGINVSNPECPCVHCNAVGKGHLKHSPANFGTPQPILVLQSTPGQLSPGPKQCLMLQYQDCR